MRRHSYGVAVIASAMAAAMPASFIPSGAHAAEAAASGDNSLHLDEIFVTASPIFRGRYDVIQGTSVLTGDRLAAALRPSIGETLASQPGVTSTFFGPYASRPIIRGFDGDRVRVLFDGIGSIDASSVSPDHETAGDALGAERIEVLRGPATLLYGTSAIGGVVNIIDGRIPEEIAPSGYHGHLIGGYGTNADERFASGALDVGVGEGLILHAGGGWRKTDDYRIPGFASPEAEEDGVRGRVANSSGRTTSGTGGVSYVWGSGVVGASLQRFTSNYGAPGHHHHHEEDEDHDHDHDDDHEHEDDHDDDHDHEDEHGHADEIVRIALRQTRVDLKGEVRDLGGFIAAVRARAAYGDYRHDELEDGAVGTTFVNRGWEGRVEAVHAPIGAMNGVFGVQYRLRDFEAIGAEAFSPPSRTRQVAGFLLESAVVGPWRFEAGGRLEDTRISLPGAATERDFLSAAASAAAAYELAPNTLFGVTASWTERPPTAEELFSDGPHLATSQFELGNPALKEEAAVNLEATLRRSAGPVTGSVSVYRTWYDRFIYAQDTGLEEDGLPVFQFVATDARFTGLEGEIAWRAVRTADYALTFDAGLDLVRATDTATGLPLPRISPLRYRGGVDFTWRWLDARVEVAGAAAQNRVAAAETPTEGYTFLNARVGVRPLADHDVQVVVQAQNLTNAAARPHTSFLKGVAPLPGRDVRLYLRAAF